ncbi:hypothetical protein ATO46_11220 [Aeromonas schubertii]|uniref:hypothetical protein n=1 Tax=Aeromonas schubertii TaxID=652 RepID=UPI00067F31DC|nr:hypothetical protein [Aeromonas schubertii]KUE78255.1 hypothetical protein ATO46_11220 [Aeromonas schubertii]
MKWFGWLCLYLPLLVQAQTLTVRVPRLPVNQMAEQYQLPLLRLALEKSGIPFEITEVPTTLTQDSISRELEKGKQFNLFWMGTSSDLEQRLTPIPVPLFRGLEGVRVAIIHRDAQETFARINNLDELRQHKAVQGVGWGDNRILEAAGIPTYAGRFHTLFHLINDHQEVDFFPRALVEAYSERRELAEQYPNLMIDTHLQVRYPYAQFFFVGHDETELAKALQTGLERLYADGSFLRFFRGNPLVRDALARANLGQRVTIDLANPDMTPTLRAVPAAYWEWPQP